MTKYIIDLTMWLTPVIYAVGIGVSLWAFLRSRKAGYFLFFIYFMFLAYMNYQTIFVDKYIEHKIYQSFEQEVQEQIYKAMTEAVVEIMEEQGAYGRAAYVTVEFPYGPLLLVLALWLVGRNENTKCSPSSKNQQRGILQDSSNPNTKRPTSLTVVAIIIIMSAAFMLISSMEPYRDASSWMIWLGIVASFPIAIGILKRQRWSRWLYVILGVIGFLIILLSEGYQSGIVPSMLSFATIVFFLFTPEANQYFLKDKSPNQASETTSGSAPSAPPEAPQG